MRIHDPAWDEALEHRGLALKIGRKLAACYRLDFDDLVQEGMLGLHRAVLNHDPARGEFRHFAPTVIRNAMADYRRVTEKRGRNGVRIESGDAADSLAAHPDRIDILSFAEALDALEAIPEPGHTTLRLWCGLDDESMTLGEVAEAHGVKRDAAKKAKKQAVAALRLMLGAEPA